MRVAMHLETVRSRMNLSPRPLAYFLRGLLARPRATTVAQGDDRPASRPRSFAGHTRLLVTASAIVVAALLCRPMQAQEPVLRVALLGTGTPTPSTERLGPSILVQAGVERLVFDVGRGVFGRVTKGASVEIHCHQRSSSVLSCRRRDRRARGRTRRRVPLCGSRSVA